MTPLDQVNDAIAATGPHLDAIDEIIRTQDDAWVLRCGSADIEIFADAERGLFSFQGIVGSVPEADRPRIYTTLLQYNLLQSETGGVVLALNAEEEVVQMLALRIETPSPDTFSNIVANFLARMAVWERIMVAQTEPNDEIDDTSFLIQA